MRWSLAVIARVTVTNASAVASFTASTPLKAGGSGQGPLTGSGSLTMKDLKFAGLGPRAGAFASINSEFSFNINPFADEEGCK